MGKGIKNNGGFSLMELLVGLAISCIVLVAAYSFVVTGIKSYERTKKTTEIQQETQFIENIIADAVENGKEGISSITINPPGLSNGVVFDTGYQKLYYDKDRTILALYNATETEGTDIDKHVVSKHVEDFSVSYINTELETDALGNKVYNEISATPTSLVEVKVKVSLNGKKSNFAQQYKFRNS